MVPGRSAAKEVIVGTWVRDESHSPPSKTSNPIALEKDTAAASYRLANLLDRLGFMPSRSNRVSAARDKVDLLRHDGLAAVLADGGLGLVAAHLVLVSYRIVSSVGVVLDIR